MFVEKRMRARTYIIPVRRMTWRTKLFAAHRTCTIRADCGFLVPQYLTTYTGYILRCKYLCRTMMSRYVTQTRKNFTDADAALSIIQSIWNPFSRKNTCVCTRYNIDAMANALQQRGRRPMYVKRWIFIGGGGPFRKLLSMKKICPSDKYPIHFVRRISIKYN